MSELVNPYIAGAPVVEARMFFGREDIFDWIQSSLTGRYADHILVIHGQRRVGKTSVLKQLGNRLPEKYIPVFFDLQGRTHTTIDRFLWWLAREIVRVLKQERDISIPPPEKEIFAADAEYFEHRFLPELRAAIGDHSLLLTFDEFDNLEESEIKEELARPLIDYLRRLMGESGLNFIFSIGSSGRKLENMQASYTEFFKAALYKKISFLSREQTHNLVTRPVDGLLEYDPEAVDRIYEIVSGHPYFTQLTCHELFSLCQRTGELRIRETDVEAVLEDVVERGTVNLKFTWDEASDIEKWTLAALAHAKDGLDNRHLADTLHKQRVRFSDPDLTSGVLHLREKDILTEENQFVIQLLRLWLQKNRTMEQVREELTEVNPIANRYIEIGLEFQDAGQYDRAIENFREALNVASDHIQAQVNIALAYQAQGVLDQAVQEFEKALAMDDEDVSARSGLCGAHLALGDAAMAKNRNKDAIASYQKVLDINAEHTEARQRMAEINRQRAEKAMIDGRDEEALAAFAEAMKFTPEDEALSQRYEQAKVEKRAKVVASLLSKAEKELSSRNWDAALSILQNALEIDPQNEKVQKRLETVREEQRKAGLAALLARADRARQAGRWGLVIAALEEYLVQQPGDAKIQARIFEARQKLTKAQAEEALARAASLTRQERFEEALAAWEEYRKINPADEQAVQAEIDKIRKAQALVATYSEAQAAFARKNYDRAVALFKDIVVQDENYRDASRRMAEAIELRRATRRWWQSRWLRGGVASLIVLTVAWFLFRPDSPLLQVFTSQADQPTQSEGIQTPLPSAAPYTPMPTITATPTLVPLVWTRLNSGQFFPKAYINSIIIDPTDPGIMYIGTLGAGNYKSIDGGNSWQPSQSGLEYAGTWTMIMSPSNPEILYTGTYAGGVFKSVDRGTTWQASNDGIDSTTSFNMRSIILIDPENGQHFLFTQGSSLFESSDAGATWQKNNQTSCPSNISGLVIHPQNSQILYAASWGDSDGTCQSGTYQSHDGGSTWEFKGSSPSGRLFINPDGTRLFSSGPNTLMSSSDEGVTWHNHLDEQCAALVFVPGQEQVVFCGTFSGKIERSQDGGMSWTKLYSTPDGSQIRAIALSPGNPNVIWAGGNNLLYSNDSGKTWTPRDSGLGGGLFSLIVDPFDEDILYASIVINETWVYRSRDQGRTWDLIEDSRGLSIFAIGTSPGILLRISPDDFQNGLISKDGGDTWGSITASDVANYYRPPSFEYRLGTDGLEFTADGGQTWVACGGDWLITGTIVPPLVGAVIDPNDNSRSFIGITGLGIFESTDNCQSWAPRNNGLRVLGAYLVIDPKDSDTLYAASDGGAYISTDGGQNWGTINDGLLGATVVYSIVVDKDSNVYAATPYGIFKLEGK